MATIKNARTIENALRESGYEFWKSATRETYSLYLNVLLEKGFSQDEALEMLIDLYSATSGEYGN
jgi:hypothetical protein